MKEESGLKQFRGGGGDGVCLSVCDKVSMTY